MGKCSPDKRKRAAGPVRGGGIARGMAGMGDVMMLERKGVKC